MRSKFLEQPSTSTLNKEIQNITLDSKKYLTNINVMLSAIKMPDLIKKIPSNIKKNKLKTGLFLGLSAYWGIILVGTLVQFN